MKAYSLLLLLPLMSMSKCDEDVFEKHAIPAFALPPATQSGANTIGFILDNRVWRDYGVSCTTFRCDSNKVRGLYTTTGEQFTLYAGLSGRDISGRYIDEDFSINLSQITSVGVYSSDAIARWMSFSNGPYSEYLSSPGKAAIVITKLDTTQHIIAGTFSGVLRYRADITKAITVSDGRFDIRYR
ncbi:hypothetical protein BEN47_17905 [Hymenobacter lapidarius]|uniref:Uncharacterized protein n=1 Tax=Hymenobacter lapidarius TaxID=1908237 RepID=A0A1G1SWV9_9BACT|nr:hypothetical protein [Hymenobacter lapidarius]OGX83098.1 hypothetical protein BEN47_17905 [Hymenobacter lapidarius]